MSVIHADAIEYDFGGSRTRIHVSGAHTGDAYCVLEIASPAGRATPMHHHDREEETIVIVEGALKVVVNGAPKVLHAGESLTLARGERHQLINVGAQTARYLVICVPAGFDRFVQACADPQPAPAELHEPTVAAKSRMVEAAARFGITIHPPAAARE
ncbi:cupin domain-containing protein [Caballeronia sp. LZ035]|uniref:cupin domain-containing protein n=1 Tax=Caballeronia sp. LZ035 TaxID=3038568 RepID=UPI0028587D23|nr:cupin domain-containing protein [Caballeronia sp. LZ035]MDR5761321.1 cupin domain-containing protein [Caballeronia sp. LZ035]